MTWIRTIPMEAAEGDLAVLYERVVDPKSGKLDHILAAHSLHTRGLSAHFELYSAVMSGTRGLRKVERELIALVVSALNECHY